MTHRVLRITGWGSLRALTCPRCSFVVVAYATEMPHLHDVFCCGLRFIWVHHLYKRDRRKTHARRVSKKFWELALFLNRDFVKRGLVLGHAAKKE